MNNLLNTHFISAAFNPDGQVKIIGLDAPATDNVETTAGTETAAADSGNEQLWSDIGDAAVHIAILTVITIAVVLPFLFITKRHFKKAEERRTIEEDSISAKI